MGGSSAVARGRDAGRRLAWADAYRLLSRVDPPESLTGEDLELLAAAAYLVGEVADCRQALQRAHQAHLRNGDVHRAARCLFWVAFTLLLQG
ncbi:MAG TPA: helix-turn-helix transcriptional regulator, partial [Actinomycetes bacterium]